MPRDPDVTPAFDPALPYRARDGREATITGREGDRWLQGFIGDEEFLWGLDGSVYADRRVHGCDLVNIDAPPSAFAGGSR